MPLTTLLDKVLPKDEQRLIRLYRLADEQGKRNILTVASNSAISGCLEYAIDKTPTPPAD